MAEILVWRVSRTHPDPDANNRTLKAGDVVKIEETGYTWGTEEHPATASPLPWFGNTKPFYIFRVTDKTKAEIESVMEDTEADQVEFPERGKWRYYLDVNDLKANQLATLENDILDLNFQQARKLVKHKKTNAEL